MKNHIIILLKSWISTPLESHTYFSIEILWTTFIPTQHSSIDSMLSEDTQ